MAYHVFGNNSYDLQNKIAFLKLWVMTTKEGHIQYDQSVIKLLENLSELCRQRRKQNLKTALIDGYIYTNHSSLLTRKPFPIS